MKLAEKLINELLGQNGSGTLESWMAARIAELMTREKQVKGEKLKEACRKECSELICSLWSIRQERDPQSIRNRINQNLAILINAGGQKRRLHQTIGTISLEAHCDLKVLNRESLLARLFAINDEQKDLLLLLGTDDLLDPDVLPENLDQSRMDKLFGLREQILKASSEEKSWRVDLKAAESRKERLAILHSQVNFVGRETQQIAKELKERD